MTRLVTVVGIALAFVLALTTVGGSVGTAAAAGTDAISGTVVDGTAGAALPRGLVVTLQRVGPGHQSVVNQKASVGASGRFTFADVPTDPSVSYFVSTEYAGVPYVSTVPKANGGATTTVPVKVYEPTTSDTAIKIDDESWLLGSVDVDKQQALVLVTLVVSNDGDRVYVGDHRGDPGSAVPGILPRTLRVTLPRGASDFQPQLGLDPAALLPVEGGFVDTAPVLPGQHDLAYTYRIGFAETVAEIQATLSYPTAKLRFLAPDGLGFRSDHFGDDGTVQLQGQTYRVLGADQLKADTTVTVDVIGLPAVTASRLSPRDMQLGGLALIALAIVLALYVGLRSRGARVADPLAERRVLLASIAQLDDRYAAGQLGDERYRAERARQKRQLIDLIVGGRASTNSSGVS